MKLEIYTIGHSNLAIEAFLQLLTRHAITAVADVRSSPYSRLYPQFNREPLRAALLAAGVQYMFMGDQLGGRPAGGECYDEKGRVCYERVAALPEFQQGLLRLLEDAQRYRVALMCAEKDPIACHRMLLVGRYLKPHGVTIKHILGDGSLESNAAAERRLFDAAKVPHEDLFESHAELLERAYAQQSSRASFALLDAESGETRTGAP